MSKPFARQGPPQSRTNSQINKAPIRERNEIADKKDTRREAVNHGQGNELSKVEIKRLEREEKKKKKSGEEKKLPTLQSPDKRAYLLNVSECDLKKPSDLRQKPLTSHKDLLFPRLHGVEVIDDENTVGTSLTTQSVSSKDANAEDAKDDNADLEDILLGLPGGLALDAQTSSKYFGIEARFKFMQRVQWLSNQRNISCFEPDEYASNLVFTNADDEGPLEGSYAFGAVRPADQLKREEFKKAASSHSSNDAEPSLQATLAAANDDFMLRMSRLRSGDDYRDEEDEDLLNPALAAAEEKNMLEELERIAMKEKATQEANRDAHLAALVSEEDYQMQLQRREKERDGRVSRSRDTLSVSASPRTKSEATLLKVRNLIRNGGTTKENSWKLDYHQHFGTPRLSETPRKKAASESGAGSPTSRRRSVLASTASRASVLAGTTDHAPRKEHGHREAKDSSKVQGAEPANSAHPTQITSLTFNALSEANLAFGALKSSSEQAETTAEDDDARSDVSGNSGISTTGMRGYFLKKNVSQASPMSPRSQYISNCIREGLNPRASLILRKSMSKRLELQNYGMGDQMAAILAESIADLPHLRSINIADNRLTDDGMGPIISAAVQIKGLLELNLSKNEIGDVAAEALAEYLKREDCPLQKLVLQSADVDDFEAAAFLGAVMENRSLTELDLSSNLIGGAENLNTVYPDLTTGSEALADLLRTDGIKLKTLKLVWNMMRLDGAVDFCSSLAVNNTLTYLDLSYNSLAQDGGIMLGMSLEDNHSLETLVIANNSIDAIACFTICVGIIHNYNLKKVVLDGNPIAEQGARALMLVPMHAGGRVSLSAAKCNVTMKDPRCWFDLNNPCREYELDLSNGFERAVAKVVLMAIASHHSFIFESMEYKQPDAKAFTPFTLKQAASRERMKYFSKREKEIVSSLNKIVDCANDIKGAVRLFQEVDVDGSGEVDKDELGELIRSMGMNLSESRIDEIFALYDVDGGGSIGLSEFLAFLKTQKQESSNRLKDMCEIPIMMDPSAPTGSSGEPLPWVPPREGSMKCKVVDGFATKPIFRVMSAMDQANILAVVQNASGGEGIKGAGRNGPSAGGKSGEAAGSTAARSVGGAGGAATALLERGLVGTKLRLDEALSCCVTMLQDGKDPTKVMRMILPQMEGAKDAQAIVRQITNGDRAELMKLKREIGNALRPILGAPNGYYICDLSDEMDRFCMIRLLEISKTQAVKRQASHAYFEKTQIGDLSQKRNWSCFRNELLDSKPIVIDEVFATPLPRKGMLEFDFVCAARPSREDVALPDTRIVKVLVNSFLLEPEDALKALHRLRHYFEAGEKSLDCDGHTVYEQPTSRAHAIGLALDEFYNNSHERRTMYMAALAKEATIKTDKDGKVVDDLDDDDVNDADLNSNNKDGMQLSISEGMQSILDSSGIDPSKKKKHKKSVKEITSKGKNSPSKEDEDEGTGNEDDDAGSAPATDAESAYSSGNEEEAMEVLDDGSLSLASTTQMPSEAPWTCDSCQSENESALQHCKVCGHSNPNHVMGHGIGIAFDPDTIGASGSMSQAKMVQKALKNKSGRVEGMKRESGYNMNKLLASEQARHASHEMDSDYSSELENADQKGGFHSSSSESGEDEEGDDDMRQFMKLKIKEKKAFERKRKLERREQARKIRAEAREKALQAKKARRSRKGFEPEVSHEISTSDVGSSGATEALSPVLKAQVGEDGLLLRAGGETDTRLEARAAGVGLTNEERADERIEPRAKKTEMELFAEKMRMMLELPNVHIGLKARRMIEWMEEVFGRVWIMCRHLMLILQCFRSIGHKKQTKYFGTYRVDLLVALYHRVVDLHNFEIVLKCLSPFEVAATYARLGWLHLWNPCKPEGGWELDLTRPEERLVAKFLCELATVEPGDNWIEQYFQWQRDVDGMPGWELTTPWLTEDGMPARGILMVYYFSGDGKGQKGCKPNVPFRKSLLQQVLIEEEDIVEEGFRDRAPPNPIGVPYMLNNAVRWKQYIGAIVDLTRVR